MPENPEPVPEPAPAQIVPPEEINQDMEQEAGDFITRHVLEKDSVFFEG
jgi:hypothetical protein